MPSASEMPNNQSIIPQEKEEAFEDLLLQGEWLYALEVVAST